jgi:hypothetical protein
MRHLFRPLLLALVLAAPASAGTVTTSLQITIQAPFALVFTPPAPTLPCTAAAGTVVSALSTTGGDGNPVTYSLTGSSDFVVSGANIIVAPAGLASADCGRVISVTVTANQS